MKIALLSSGPSVLESWSKADQDSYDVTVGVSTTCWYIDVDYMCWMDGIAIRGMIERGRQPIKGCVWHVDDLKFWPELEHYAYPFLSDDTKPEYTFPNAVNWILHHFECPEIEIYGNDMSSEPNVCGNAYNHVEQRWIDESMQLKRVLDEYKAKINAKS